MMPHYQAGCSMSTSRYPAAAAYLNPIFPSAAIVRNSIGKPAYSFTGVTPHQSLTWR